VIDTLLDRLLAFSAEQKQRRVEQREQALYKAWVDLLSAKTELEKMRRVRLPFAGLDRTGEFVRLIVRPETDASGLLDQDVVIPLGPVGPHADPRFTAPFG
jgi:hypothetical protein